MKFLLWLLRLLVFALALMFSVRNTAPVTIYGLPGMQVHAPLVVVLLVAFIVGAVFAWGCLLPSWLRARRAAHDVQQVQPVVPAMPTAAASNTHSATVANAEPTPSNASGGAGHGV